MVVIRRITLFLCTNTPYPSFHMETRRDFLKKVAMLSAVAGTLPPSIQKAFAINPAPGTTYLDAEHVVILMM